MPRWLRERPGVGSRRESQVHAIESARRRAAIAPRRCPAFRRVGRYSPGGSTPATRSSRDRAPPARRSLADPELERLGRRRTQPDGLLGQQPLRLRPVVARALASAGCICSARNGSMPSSFRSVPDPAVEPATRSPDSPQPCRACAESREQLLVEAGTWRLHGEIRQAEQPARGDLHLVRGDAIDQIDREPERDPERDREDGQQRAARRLAQRPDCRGIEQREPGPKRFLPGATPVPTRLMLAASARRA